MRDFHVTNNRPGLLPLCLVVCLASGAGACAPAVAVFRTAAPAGVARSTESVRVYMDEKSAPAGYQELGLIIANSHVFIPVNFSLDTQLALAVQSVRRGNARDTSIFRALLRKAARLGADAIIIKGFSRHDVNLSISAVAIRTRCIPRAALAPRCPPGTVPAPGYAPAPTPAPTLTPAPAPSTAPLQEPEPGAAPEPEPAPERAPESEPTPAPVEPSPVPADP